VLGVARGATLGAVVALYSGLALSILVVPSAAFVVALATAATVYRLAARGPVVSTSALVLAGLAVSALTSALSSLVLSVALADWELGRQLLSWMLGGLENRTLAHVLVLAPLALVPSLALAFYARDLDALALGEEQALAVGVDVVRVRRGVLVLSSLLTAATVSVMGIVPFVGLVVPHASRFLSGPGHRKSFLTSALLGALLLVLADTTSRALAGTLDLRPGVLTSLIGGPFFVALVRGARQRDEGHA
jgi:iron complex transport system permease protein